MAEDWAINVRKYAPQADPEVIAGIIRHCGIALHSRDASLVSFGDTAETDRVRESFLKKKLGVMESDEQLDTSIAAVGAKMKDEHFRHRVTVYYLLADHYGKLDAFRKSSAHAAPHAAEAHAAPSHANGTHTAEPAAPAAAYKAPSTPASEPRAAPHAVETRATEASAPASLYTAPSEPRSAEPRAAEARSADSSATYRAPGNIADTAKSNIADTAKAGAAGIGNFGAAGLAAGAAGLGAGGAAIKGAFDGGSSAGSGAAQGFVSRSTVDEPVTRSGGGMRWLLWLILAIAVILLVAYLMGYRF